VYAQDVNYTVVQKAVTLFHFTTHRVSKNGANLFLSELRQMFINFYNFGQKDGKEVEIM